VNDYGRKRTKPQAAEQQKGKGSLTLANGSTIVGIDRGNGPEKTVEAVFFTGDAWVDDGVEEFNDSDGSETCPRYEPICTDGFNEPGDCDGGNGLDDCATCANLAPDDDNLIAPEGDDAPACAQCATCQECPEGVGEVQVFTARPSCWVEESVVERPCMGGMGQIGDCSGCVSEKPLIEQIVGAASCSDCVDPCPHDKPRACPAADPCDDCCDATCLRDAGCAAGKKAAE
jgi:hypothetical protein